MRRNQSFKYSVVFLLVIINFCACKKLPEKNDYYPVFNWDKVPVYIHYVDKDEPPLQDLSFVASHSDFVCLEKGFALNKFGTTEKGIENTAGRLKQLNPDIKVIFYWNSFLDYNIYEAHEEYSSHPEWWLKTIDGELDLKFNSIKRYDLSNPEVRNWHTNVARKGTSGSCDGIFMDAFPQVYAKANIKLWGEEKYNEMQQGLIDLIKETRQKIGNDKIILYNGIRNTKDLNFGKEYLPFTDAAMIEHFDAFFSTSKESVAQDIEDMIFAGKMGKIVIMKAWPGFTVFDKDVTLAPHDSLFKESAKNITFPLACFLIAAQPFSYFNYTWGYQKDDGSLDWYPEFDKPLGKPKGQAIKNGWIYTREYKHCSVMVDLEKKEATIEWKK